MGERPRAAQSAYKRLIEASNAHDRATSELAVAVKQLADLVTEDPAACAMLAQVGSFKGALDKVMQLRDGQAALLGQVCDDARRTRTVVLGKPQEQSASTATTSPKPGARATATDPSTTRTTAATTKTTTSPPLPSTATATKKPAKQTKLSTPTVATVSTGNSMEDRMIQMAGFPQLLTMLQQESAKQDATEESGKRLQALLVALAKLRSVTSKVLETSGAGKVVAQLKRDSREAVANAARATVRVWKDRVRHEEGQRALERERNNRANKAIAKSSRERSPRSAMRDAKGRVSAVSSKFAAKVPMPASLPSPSRTSPGGGNRGSGANDTGASSLQRDAKAMGMDPQELMEFRARKAREMEAERRRERERVRKIRGQEPDDSDSDDDRGKSRSRNKDRNRGRKRDQSRKVKRRRSRSRSWDSEDDQDEDDDDERDRGRGRDRERRRKQQSQEVDFEEWMRQKRKKMAEAYDFQQREERISARVGQIEDERAVL